MDNIEHRAEIAKNAKRVVIKLGTRLLTGGFEAIPSVVEGVARLIREGKEVIVVSSGSVGLGMEAMQLKTRPGKLSQAQALAALGQSKLMAFYERECAKHGFHAAQILLTAGDLRDRKRHLNVLNCLDALWRQENLPVVNENDSVSVDEIRLGDNDTLAALLAVMTRADILLILTTVDGLMETGADGKTLQHRVPLVESVTDEIQCMAEGTDDSTLSTGGMATKIAAAAMLSKAGARTVIANGRGENVVERVLRGDDIGTLFLPASTKQMRSKKRWFDFFSPPVGKLVVDNGAVEALARKGKSLLPSGIVRVEGSFERGDTVEIVSETGDLVAKGLTNLSAREIAEIAGRKSAEARNILGPVDDEAVHRDNMVVANEA
jgi:glutamate 5-kinase